jgi:hypothetical protein
VKGLTAWWILALALWGGVGCATSPPRGLKGDPLLLSFLNPGVTQRAEVLERLGEPATVFQSDAILTYRIAGDPKQGFWVRGRAAQSEVGWIGVNRSLVLVFDEHGLLQRQSLVVVQ